MLYTASFFEPQYQSGRLLSISRSIPSGVLVDGELPFFIPTADLLADREAKKIDAFAYTERYRMQIRSNWKKVNKWLESLNPLQPITLLTWQNLGEFCHRNLIAKLVQKYRPDCFGGCDVIRVEMERCYCCGTELLAGLDASFCRNCKTWLNHWSL